MWWLIQTESHKCEIHKNVNWCESVANKSVSPCFVYLDREKLLEMPKSRSHVFLSPPLEGVVHLCHRGCCFHLWTSTPVAIATVMGERVRSGSERPVFSSPSWSVLAPRPVTAAVSRRCEVWLSAGGGATEGLWWERKMMLGIVFLLSADTTVTVRFSLSLSIIVRCFFQSAVSSG